MTRPAAGAFAPAGSLVRPSLVGRGVRLALGAAILASLPGLVASFPAFRAAARAPSSPAFWALAALLVGSAHHIVDLGLGVAWGRRPRTVLLAGLALAAAAGLAVHGRLWAPPLALTLWATILVLALPLGVAFVLAALLATPGCEMRAFADAGARLRGRDAREHHCPGGIDAFDRLELRLRRRGDGPPPGGPA